MCLFTFITTVHVQMQMKPVLSWVLQPVKNCSKKPWLRCKVIPFLGLQPSGAFKRGLNCPNDVFFTLQAPLPFALLYATCPLDFHGGAFYSQCSSCLPPCGVVLYVLVMLPPDFAAFWNIVALSLQWCGDLRALSLQTLCWSVLQHPPEKNMAVGSFGRYDAALKLKVLQWLCVFCSFWWL